jgi:hypothetical protein
MKKKIKFILERKKSSFFLSQEEEPFKRWFFKRYNEKFNMGAVMFYDITKTDFIKDTYGIRFTSSSIRRKHGNNRIYYYDVVDEKKLAIFILKYGFEIVK